MSACGACQKNREAEPGRHLTLPPESSATRKRKEKEPPIVPTFRGRYHRPSERKGPRLPPPDKAEPQFVWLSKQPNPGQLEDDGVTPYRDINIVKIYGKKLREWKKEAPDLDERTLYYVPDNMFDPYSGNELPVLDHRVDKHSSSYNFHSRIDILTRDTHSFGLVCLVHEYRSDMDQRECVPEPGCENDWYIDDMLRTLHSSDEEDEEEEEKKEEVEVRAAAPASHPENDVIEVLSSDSERAENVR